MYELFFKRIDMDELFPMPSYIYETEEEAIKMCEKFNSVSNKFLHTYQKIS